ncbi:MAG: hypothetical protein HC854_17680 [Flavobacterium sp.]|nr:hypothetical protein [Flavobacterium sp.]
MEKEIKELLLCGSKGFKSELFSNVRTTENIEDKKVLELIKSETKELLAMYIEKSKESAEKTFKYYETLTVGEIIQMYGVDFNFNGVVKKTHSKKSHNFLSKVKNVLDSGLEMYLEKAESLAILNYNIATEEWFIK